MAHTEQVRITVRLAQAECLPVEYKVALQVWKMHDIINRISCISLPSLEEVSGENMSEFRGNFRCRYNNYLSGLLCTRPGVRSSPQDTGCLGLYTDMNRVLTSIQV